MMELGVEYWLAIILTTLPENSGNLDPLSKYVQVSTEPLANDLDVWSMQNIVDSKQRCQQIANRKQSADGRD